MIHLEKTNYKVGSLSKKNEWEPLYGSTSRGQDINNQFRPSYAHKNKDIDFFLRKVEKIFNKFNQLILQKKIHQSTSKRTIEGFSRLNS